METLRKIDCYGQLILGCFTILLILLFFGTGLLIGLFLIGGWQLISAIFNTNSFVHNGFQNRIYCYWMFCILDLSLLAFYYSSFELITGNIVSEVLAWITFTGAIATASYYWWMYFKFIDFISLRNELDGLTKSKH